MDRADGFASDVVQARLRGDEFYFTGKPCKHGHIAERRTKGSQCMECTRIENEKRSAKRKTIPQKKKGKDHTGARFGLWTVVERAESDGRGSARWRCICDCGTEKVVPANSLVQGKSKSCGCMTQTWRTAGVTKHGHARSKANGGFSGAYKSWHAMRQRCENENGDQYADYGGRGIKVCDRWLSFENFLADMGDRPPNLTLDRIDPDADYGPENCRWSTRKTQSLNRRPMMKHSTVFGLVSASRRLVAANDNEIAAAIDAVRLSLEEMDRKAA